MGRSTAPEDGVDSAGGAVSGNLRLLSRTIPNILRLFHGLWLSLVERLVRDEEVAGSNPVSPIFFPLARSIPGPRE